MDSNPQDKTLNSILNTILRTLAPKEQLRFLEKKIEKKIEKKRIVKWKLLELNIAISRKNSGACDTVLKIADSNNRDWKWMKILKTDCVQGVSLLPPALLVQKETLQNYMSWNFRPGELIRPFEPN